MLGCENMSSEPLSIQIAQNYKLAPTINGLDKYPVIGL